jgi:hypothetical protein
MTYVFDIDGTICTKTDGDYQNAIPIIERVEKVNTLYDSGHKIILLTARGMGRSENSIDYAYNTFYDLTRQQLIDWGVKYHDLFLGKPSGDFYIDDKGINDEDFFNTGN